MKWVDKGTEYDAVYSKTCDLLNSDKSVIVYGASNIGRIFTEKLYPQLKISFFVDRDVESLGREWNSYEVIHPDDLENRRFDEPIIVATSYYGQMEIRSELLRRGYIEWRDFYVLDTMIELCDLYQKNYIKIPLLEFPITGKCTLKCENCGFFLPYYKSSKEYDAVDVLDNIHLAFKRFDHISTIRFVGGEPFLHSRLAEICLSIFEDYSGRFDKITLITNGTVPLSEKLKSVVEGRTEFFFVSVSDYSQAIGHNYRERVELFLSQLLEYNIPFHVESLRKWYDYGFPKNKDASPECVASRVFDSCLEMDCRTVWDRKLWYCSSACSAYRGELLKPKEGNDYIDLNLTLDKKIMFEFLNGYSIDGFNELCRYCRVPQNIKIEPGHQMT